MASLRVDVSVTPDDMPIAPLTKRAFDPATMAPPVMASPLAIGVASITSNIASGLHVPVPSKLSRNLTRPQSCFVKAEGLHGDGSPVASDNTSPPRRGSLRGGLDAMFTAASEGEVMTRFIGTVHGDSPPASEGDGSAIPSHLRDVSFGPGAQGSDVLRRSAMGRRPSALDIETSIRTGKINRAISLPNSPAGLAPDTARSWLKTDLAIIGNFSSDAAPMSPMRGAFPMRQPMMSASRRTSRMAPSPASINVTVAKATDTSTATTGSNDHSAAPSPPSRAFTFSSHHTDSPRSHDSPAPDVPTPKYPPNTSPVRVDTMALWKRVRTAFMKFAEARAAEIEDLFVAQQQRAKDAVNSGKVSTVDKGENVPLKNQGDLAHYTLGALRQRRRLKRHHAIKQAIEKHWVLITSMKPDDQKHVTRDEYIAYFLVAYGVLMPEENVDVSVKLVAIEADWEDDSKGEEVLSHDRFVGALFELVDNWCESISAVEYIRLLEDLYHAVYYSMRVGNAIINAIEPEDGSRPNIPGSSGFASTVMGDGGFGAPFSALMEEAEDDDSGSDVEDRAAGDDNPSENRSTGAAPAKKGGARGGRRDRLSVGTARSASSVSTGNRNGSKRSSGSRPESFFDAGYDLGPRDAGPQKESHPVWKSGWRASNPLSFSGGLDPSLKDGKDVFRAYPVFTAKDKSSKASSSAHTTPRGDHKARNSSSTVGSTATSGMGGGGSSSAQTTPRQLSNKKLRKVKSENTVRNGRHESTHRSYEYDGDRDNNEDSCDDDEYAVVVDDTDEMLAMASRHVRRSEGDHGSAGGRGSPHHPDIDYTVSERPSTTLHSVRRANRTLLPSLRKVDALQYFGAVAVPPIAGSKSAGDATVAATNGRAASPTSKAVPMHFGGGGLQVDTALKGFVSPVSPPRALPSDSIPISSSLLSLTSSKFEVDFDSMGDAIGTRQPLQSPSKGHSGAGKDTLTSPSSALHSPPMRMLKEQMLEARMARHSPLARMRSVKSTALAHDTANRLNALQHTPVSMAELREALRAEVCGIDTTAPPLGITASPSVASVTSTSPTSTSPIDLKFQSPTHRPAVASSPINVDRRQPSTLGELSLLKTRSSPSLFTQQGSVRKAASNARPSPLQSLNPSAHKLEASPSALSAVGRSVTGSVSLRGHSVTPAFAV